MNSKKNKGIGRREFIEINAKTSLGMWLISLPLLTTSCDSSSTTQTVFTDIATDQNRIFNSESPKNLYTTSRNIIETPEKALNLFNSIQMNSNGKCTIHKIQRIKAGN